jgi:hypothetical protein
MGNYAQKSDVFPITVRPLASHFRQGYGGQTLRIKVLFWGRWGIE